MKAPIKTGLEKCLFQQTSGKGVSGSFNLAELKKAPFKPKAERKPRAKKETKKQDGQAKTSNDQLAQNTEESFHSAETS